MSRLAIVQIKSLETFCTLKVVVSLAYLLLFSVNT